MNEHEFDERWLAREAHYPGWHQLPTDRPVHIHIDSEYAGTYAGQVAAITAASLFGRMTKTVSVDVPALQLVDPLPWTNCTLDEVVIQTLEDSHPYGVYDQRPARRDDLRLVIGPKGDGLVIHGCGWGAYCGPNSSPIGLSDEPNPFGAAFAVVAAASQLQQDFHATAINPITVDTYLWRAGLPSADVPRVLPNFALGELWSIGVGSVGSCGLFFLSFVTRDFRAVLVDADHVKVENVTRSALFSWRDALERENKADVAGHWLNKAGVQDVERQVAWLDEIPDRWRGRKLGTPDIVISAANERNVRSVIEHSLPPLQVYSTTGRNWQATLFRHIPLIDPCSLCVPGDVTPQTPLLCATGSSVPDANNQDDNDDVALPFLSYAAGLMTASEITKLALVGEVVTPNRVFFEPRAKDLVRVVKLNRRPGCICCLRDDTLYEHAIRGSRFNSLS